MTSYLSGLLTTTTSRYNNLRRSLLANEADGDTEDDTHIARVLRAYHVEKARPFPPWLPPDPRAKVQQAAPQAYAASSRPGLQTSDSSASARRPGGGLGDLWDPPSAQQPGVPQPSSLRRNRGLPGHGGGRGSGGSDGALAPPTSAPQGSRPPQLHAQSQQNVGGSTASAQRGGWGDQLHPSASAPQTGSRPYPPRSDGITPPPPPGSSGSGGGTAQERLKARLLGQRSGSPVPGGSRPGSYGSNG